MMPSTEEFERCLDEFGRDYSKFEDRIPTRVLSQIQSHAQKHFKAQSKGRELYGAAAPKLDRAATGRVAAAVAAAEAAMANEGGEPPTGVGQSVYEPTSPKHTSPESRCSWRRGFHGALWRRASVVPGGSSLRHEQNLIVKIDSDRCLRGKSQFLVGFDFGRDACQCCGRGVGKGRPRGASNSSVGSFVKVKAAAEKAERDAGNLVDPAVAKAERDAAAAAEKAERDAAEKDRARAAMLQSRQRWTTPGARPCNSRIQRLPKRRSTHLWVTAPRPWFVLRARDVQIRGHGEHDHSASVGDAEDLVVAVVQASQVVIERILRLVGRRRFIFNSDDVVEAMRQRDESVAALLRRRVDDANRALSVAENAVLHATADEVEAAHLERD